MHVRILVCDNGRGREVPYVLEGTDFVAGIEVEGWTDANGKWGVYRHLKWRTPSREEEDEILAEYIAWRLVQ